MAKAGELDHLPYWCQALEAERQYRNGSLDPAAADDAREKLIAQLELMAERVRAAPGWVEPTAAERAASVREVEIWLREYSARHDHRS